MNQKEKESLLRGLYGAMYYRCYHERKFAAAKASGDKTKIRKCKELLEFANGLAQQARFCITDIYNKTGRTGSLDAKEMARAIVAIKRIAYEDAAQIPPAQKKPKELTHFIRSLDIDDDEDEGRLLR